MTGTVAAVVAAIEGSGLAGAVRESLFLTAGLSATHLLGLTLVGGGALMSGLHHGGLLFADEPAGRVVRPARRAIAVGVAISVLTGALLWAPRASAASSNSIFRLKMALLLVAWAWGVLSTRPSVALGRFRWASGLVGPLLYGAVILAGCAYILLE